MPTEMYMVEVLIKKISLKPGIYITDVSTIAVNFKFVQLINFDVDTSYFPPPEIEKDSDNRIINMNSGKTFLFIARPSNLRTLLQSDPYSLSLYDGVAEIATVSIPWKKEFSEMVKFFESLGIVKSTIVEDTVEMVDTNKKKVAKMELFLRMSCFGQNVQTMFRIKLVEDKHEHEYTFRQTNASKIFKIEKHSDDRYNPLIAATDMTVPESWINIGEGVSLTGLFEQQMQQQYQSPDTGETNEGMRLDQDNALTRHRGSENKFFNLLDFLSADVRTHEKGTEITIQKKRVRHDPFAKDRSFSAQYVDDKEEEKEDATEMTADKIARKLCGNADCPAVKKFKEYGIGPLATGKCLGTVYGDVEPAVTYGMSHTYGTMCEYGPYGVFSKPKDEALPSVPRTSESSTSKIKRKKSSCYDEQVKKKKKEPEWHSHCCPLYAERLRGGADVAGIIEEQGNADEDAGIVMPKSPMNRISPWKVRLRQILGPNANGNVRFIKKSGNAQRQP